MPSRRPTTTAPAPPALSAQAQLDAVRAQRAALRSQLAERERQAEQTDATAGAEPAARQLRYELGFGGRCLRAVQQFSEQLVVPGLAHPEAGLHPPGHASVQLVAAGRRRAPRRRAR